MVKLHLFQRQRNKQKYLISRKFQYKPTSFWTKQKGSKFLLMFQFGLVPTTNKPTNITKDTISAIDHIITNSITNSEFETAIVTADISDISQSST